MITCEACAREFKAFRGLTCPHCGYNNGASELPRTEASIRRIEERMRQEAEAEQMANQWLGLDVSTAEHDQETEEEL